MVAILPGEMIFVLFALGGRCMPKRLWHQSICNYIPDCARARCTSRGRSSLAGCRHPVKFILTLTRSKRQLETDEWPY